ncbi:MAG: ATP-binding protein [Clostridium sp.]|nr:ATP-binding protein [Prevotella sp.]MCM1428995.1 ATP-binding protein [Clostridium sp.]MCM1475475.1 ATP-binding protein [Muribaculaceae bacterium]
MGIYERQRTGKMIFIAVSLIAVIIFLIVSNNLVKELAKQERERMNIWAKATERLAKADIDADIEFLLTIISQNNSIPVMVSDENYNIVEYRNYPLPDKTDTIGTPVAMLSDKNIQYLTQRLRSSGGGVPLKELADSDPHFIKVEVYDNTVQYIYYEDSILLKRLSYYPYVQLGVMLILIVVIYLAVVYTKRAEQNRVWVGLSKETAHQLGTPISSLMAWNEYLAETGADKEVTEEINKDVMRLSTIADRFSKIGSRPEMQLEYLNDVVGSSLGYMKNRVSGRVKITMHLSEDDHGVMLSRPLFEWVMENLTKNAVDAMDGAGDISITTGEDHGKLYIDVTDTGKGIAKKNFKNVFNPGYTTKKRGWGLGLTLVKRIIEEYHGGKIYVKESTQGKGTTFRIELPVVK